MNRLSQTDRTQHRPPLRTVPGELPACNGFVEAALARPAAKASTLEQNQLAGVDLKRPVAEVCSVKFTKHNPERMSLMHPVDPE